MAVREWYSGKNILITGGTGFMGKVLVEKLLRSCSKINTIYILCRGKRGLTPSQRIANLAKLPLFERLLKENPKAINKLVAIEGDISEDSLGLSPEHKKTLEENVNVIIHAAASLRLEAGLKELVNFNVKGTLKMLELACNIKNLEVFVHMSTAFCHCEEEILEERLYEPIYYPRDIMSAVDWMNDKMIESITPTLLGQHPNCYTFTKRLAEGLIGEFGSKLPVVILRPSIVIPTLKEPMPGWVDSLNGPIGVMAAAGKGVLRSMLCGFDNSAELIPVDVAINAVITVAWQRANTKTKEVPTYNISSGKTCPVTWGELLTIGKELIQDYPFDAGLWYPGGTVRTNPYTHAIIVFLCQTIPAYLIDFIMLLTRNKRFLVRVQNRISLGLELLQYFTMRQWSFNTSNSMHVLTSLSPEEQEIFFVPTSKIDIRLALKDSIIGSRVYCLKEPLENLPRARKHLKWLYWLDKISQICLLMFLTWIFLPYIPFLQRMLNAVLPGSTVGTLINEVTKTA